jgi:hypothetical protein
LFTETEFTSETAQRAEALLEELRPESPLRHRLGSELIEICRIRQVTTVG